MEPRASYGMVGAFVLGLIAAAVVFVFWLAGAPPSEVRVPYRVHFTGSVTGLQVGALVRYRGIPVGTVKKIGFYRPTADTIDPDIIQVAVEVDKSTPIYRTTQASLDVQGLTGSPYIQLSTPASTGLKKPELLKSAPGTTGPIIRGQPSGLDKIFEDLPKTLASITRLANSASALLEKNDKRIAAILENTNQGVTEIRAIVREAQPAIKSLRTAIEGLKPAINAIESAANDTSATIKSFGKVADDIRPVIKTVDKAIADIVKGADGTLKSISDFVKKAEPALASIRQGAASVASAGKSLQNILTENRRPLADFAATGLYELSIFLTDTRKFIRTFNRVLVRIESDPAGFFFGNAHKGYRTRGR